MSANFTPSRGAYTELKPFRFWCQKVLPLVYDDSLSYYELLCKVVDYLNKTMEDVETLEDDVTNLFTAYNQLQSYVNTYFDQEFPDLVSDKLDEMAEDGTLSALLDPLVFNNLPSVVETQIDGVVEEQIGGVVGQQIGGAVSQQIGGAVSQQIGGAVGQQIDDVVEEQIGGVVGQQIGGAVGQQIGGAVGQQISPAVAAWLSSNLTPTTPAIDQTLSILDAGADAAITGGRLKALENIDGYENVNVGLNSNCKIVRNSNAVQAISISGLIDTYPTGSGTITYKQLFFPVNPGEIYCINAHKPTITGSDDNYYAFTYTYAFKFANSDGFIPADYDLVNTESVLTNRFITVPTITIDPEIGYEDHVYLCIVTTNAADPVYKVNTDETVVKQAEFTALKDDLGNFIYSAQPIAGNIYVHIPIADSVSAGVKIFAQALSVDSNVVSALLVGQYSGQRDLIDLTDGNVHTYTTVLAYTNVEILYQLSNATDGNTVYNAVCVKSDDPVSLSKSLGAFEAEAYEVFNTIDSPFDVNVDAFCRGIVAIRLLSAGPTDNFQPETIERVRVNNVYCKMSGFYLHIALQCYRNNAWENYDSITILTANAPVEQPVMIFNSTYGRVQIAIITSLMSTGSKTNAGYTFKKTAVNPFITDTQKQINTLTTELQYGNYEDQDAIKHVIHVAPNGNGDYTTIAAAYAAITDSSFVNQYEVILEPGSYEEYNLICPPYTHTHGYDWKTTIVTSENALGTSTLPVFDQRTYPSKLSNITIISGTGYCIHNDYAFINTGAVYNENLYCKKVYGEPVQNFAWQNKVNPTIIGAGAQYNGTKIVYNNCTFEDGAVTCHSNSNSVEEGNFHFTFKNCKSVNAYVQLMMAENSGAATRGLWVCEMDGFTVPVGCPALVTKVGARLNDATLFGWQIIGGNNKNFSVRLDNASDVLTTNVPWDNVNTNEKIYCQAVTAITKGQWVTDTLAAASANENHHNIMGVALADASIGDTFPVWIGNAYSVTGADGEYGIDSNGALSASATEKIGRVYKNIFYRY